jgi:type IV fimbrial biogenesis protein FimT
MPQQRPLDDRHEHGISLVETLTAIAITAIVIGTAVPSFQQSIARQRLKGRTAELVADMEYARNEAMTRNTPVRVSFRTDAHGACYVLHTGATGDCVCNAIAQTQCKDGAIEIKTAMFPSTQPIVLQPPKDFLLSQSRGTASPAASIKLQIATGLSLTARVAQTGKVRVCADDTNSMPGYKSC